MEEDERGENTERILRRERKQGERVEKKLVKTITFVKVNRIFFS